MSGQRRATSIAVAAAFVLALLLALGLSRGTDPRSSATQLSVAGDVPPTAVVEVKTTSSDKPSGSPTAQPSTSAPLASTPIAAEATPAASAAVVLPETVAPTTATGSATSSCSGPVPSQPLVSASVPSQPFKMALHGAPPRVVSKAHASCFPGGHGERCGIVVNAAIVLPAGDRDAVEAARRLLKAALARAAVWRTIPFVGEFSIAVLTMLPAEAVADLAPSAQAASPSGDENSGSGSGVTAMDAGVTSIVTVDTRKLSRLPPAGTLLQPFDAYHASPFDRSVLVNASYDFALRQEHPITRRYSPATWSLHVLDYYDVAFPPVPEWDARGVQRVLQQARRRQLGADGWSPEELDDVVSVEVEFHHPALMLFRRGRAVDSLMQEWRRVHADKGACQASDIGPNSTAAILVAHAVATVLPAACSLQIAVESEGVTARVATISPHTCGDHRISAAERCAYGRPEAPMTVLPTGVCG